MMRRAGQQVKSLPFIYVMSAFPDRRFWAGISEAAFLGWNVTRLTARSNREVSHPSLFVERRAHRCH
jgi:hypothetical protein